MVQQRFVSGLLLCLLIGLWAQRGAANTYYWDTNGSTLGAGTATSGTWGSSSDWTMSPSGTTSTSLYTTSSADTLYFVAGPSTSSGENLYTVTVSGGQSANSLTFQSSGAPTLSGGTINLWSGGLNLPPFAFGTTPQAPVTISSIIVIQASQIWTNNSSNLLTVSGKINVGANTLTIGGVGNTVLSGVVGSGSGSLVQAGSGSLILTATNNYTGGTTITSGSLQIGDGTSGHDGAIPASGGVSDNMALVYDLYGSQTYSGAISGPGSLIKVGGGSLTLSAATAIAAALQSPPAHWLRPTPARWPATILLAVLR